MLLWRWMLRILENYSIFATQTFLNAPASREVRIFRLKERIVLYNPVWGIEGGFAKIFLKERLSTLILDLSEFSQNYNPYWILAIYNITMSVTMF